MKTTIVKVQVHIMTNAVTRPWLVYAKDRKNMQEIAEWLIPAPIKAAMGEDLKGYFEAIWSAARGWVLGRRVEDQSW